MTAIDPNGVPTHTFAWGAIKWLVTPDRTGAGLAFGEVVLLPGQGHSRHNHPDSEVILYVLSGQGEQMVNDEEPFAVSAGDTIYVPLAAFHSTMNTGWQTMRLLTVCNPAGPEKELEAAPDFQELPPGSAPIWTRST